MKRLKIAELKNHARNPRKLNKHDAEHLQRSLEKFGQCEPIIVNTDGLIIGGHQRVRTLKKMGEKEVDAYVPDVPLSDKDVDELNIRLNRNAGEWDFDILANGWDLVDLLDWGFTEDDLSIDAEVISAADDEQEKDNDAKSEKLCPNCGWQLNK